MAQKPIDVIVGERLATIRAAQGVGVDQLASVLGITEAEVASYEAGTARIPPAHLIQICGFLQVSLQSLFPTLDRDHDPKLH